MGPEVRDHEIRALIAHAAQNAIEASDSLREFDSDIVAIADSAGVQDGTLLSVMRASNHSNVLCWLRSQSRSPGDAVPPNAASEVLDTAYDIALRGLQAESADAYRFAQHYGWQLWTESIFAVAPSISHARRALAMTSPHFERFVAGTYAGLAEKIGQLQTAGLADSAMERFNAVTALLKNEPISTRRASALLRYDLNGVHGAALVWTQNDSDSGEGLSARTDQALRAAGAHGVVLVSASTRMVWAWWCDAASSRPEAITEQLSSVPGVFAAISGVSPGRAGFVETHRQAMRVYDLMGRAQKGRRVVSFGEVDAVAAATVDRQLADHFVRANLGELLHAPEVLRATLRLYLAEQCNATRTARALHTHRNTVIGRIERANDLLPAGRIERPLPVELALEIAYWTQGSGAPYPLR